MADDDDLIFADTADDALNNTRPVKPLKPSASTARSKQKTRKTARVGPRRPPEEATAQRPHVLISPVLVEPILLSRSQQYTVGRGPKADVQVKTDKVSRKHAEIFWDGRCFVVQDLGSTNGSELNDRPLAPNKRVPLCHGDRLGFGGFEITVNVLEPGEFPDDELGGPTRRMKKPV